MNSQEAVNVTYLSAEKFNRVRIAINFVWQNERKDATSAALLPYLMERSCAEYSDMTVLSKKLNKLYGASLSVDMTICGNARVLSVTVSGIKNEFAISGEDLITEYAKLLVGVAFKPNFTNGLFGKQDVEIEKEKLRDELLGEINEKRIYCIKQARRKFFGDATEGIERDGYIDDIDALTPKTVTDAYYRMLNTAKIELIAIGVPQNIIIEEMAPYMKNEQKTPCAPVLKSAQKERQEESCTQNIDAAQGKLCLVFTTGKTLTEDESIAMQLGCALLGGTPTSRLFVNVREKKSLCYYCAASFSRFTNVLTVDIGIDPDKASAAKQAVLEELENIKTGEITDKELEDTKRCLLNVYRSAYDLPQLLEGFTFTEIMNGTKRTPEKCIEDYQATSKQRVKDALNKLTLSVSYLLTKEG